MMKTSVLVPILISLFTFFGMAAQERLNEAIAKVTGYGEGREIGAGIVTGIDESTNEVLVVTAFHVVEEADSIKVEFRHFLKEFPAKIFTIAHDLDAAVLRVPLQEITIDFKKQTVAESSDYRVRLVTVVGHPAGNPWTLSPNKFIAIQDDRYFTISNEAIITGEDGVSNRDPGGFSGGGVFSTNNRLMGMILQNRSRDALVLDVQALLPWLIDQKVKTNLWGGPKINFTEAGIMGGGAAGILVSLLVFEKDSKDLYSTYENHRFSDDPVYQGTTREQVFEDAQSKHNTAVVTGVVGGVVLAAGSYMLIRKLSKRKKEKRYDGLVVVPHVDMYDYVYSSGNGVTVGVTIRF